MLMGIAAIFFSFICYAQPDSLMTYEDNKQVSITIKVHDGIHYSGDCLKTTKIKCDAFEATKSKVTASSPKSGTVGHPAARYCHDKGGANRILTSKENKQYDYCIFKDGSLVDSWELFYKHYPNR
jgi:putative hemolysin